MSGERREQQKSEVRVNDRRRIHLDEEGNPVTTEATQEASGQAPGEGAPSAEEAAAPAIDPAEFEQLQRDLEASRRRVDELARAYQALDRDREEFKQRLNRERDRMLDVEKGEAAMLVLEALDQLDLVISNSAQDDSPVVKGVKMIRDGLLQKVQSRGIERIQVLGKPFDPNVADAIDMEVSPNAEDDQKVVAELRAGYRYKDRVLRPARVKVAKHVPPAQA